MDASVISERVLRIGPTTDWISHIQSARPIRPFIMEPLQILYPTDLSSGQVLLVLHTDIGAMISNKSKLVSR